MGTDTPRARLNQGFIEEETSSYWRVRVLNHTESTQNDLVHQVNISTGDVVAAEFQSHGVGRLGRSFEAPESSALLFSFYFTPVRSKSEWSFLPLLTGISVAIALSDLDHKSEAKLKWPNDIMFNEKKAGGIIAQTHNEGVIIGIGLNVDMEFEELPVQSATSLTLEGFQIMDRNNIFVKVLNILETNLHDWDSGKEFLAEYRELSSTLNRPIKMEYLNGSSELSKAVDIAKSGELILENGRLVSVADVIHLR